MILASAQTSPKRFDINANLNDHYKLIELAAKNKELETIGNTKRILN